MSLSRADAGFNLVFLRAGLATFKPESMRDRRAGGLLIAFVVDDVDAECARLVITDPNGVVVQFVQWIDT